jgi:dihydropteroate synthase
MLGSGPEVGRRGLVPASAPLRHQRSALRYLPASRSLPPSWFAAIAACWRLADLLILRRNRFDAGLSCDMLSSPGRLAAGLSGAAAAPTRVATVGGAAAYPAPVNTPETLQLGQREWPPGSFAIMAVINRTPDSFFDRGATYEFGAALKAAGRAVAAGADIVDIGGVKAGPGDEVSPTEEIRRVAGLVAAVRAAHPRVVISVDTWRAEVGEAAAAAGANLINDAWGGADPGLALVAAARGIGLVCSHAGGLAPRTGPHRPAYPDVMRDVIAQVTAAADRAAAAGVRRESILVDPAHDFGKNTWHSLEVTRRLGELAGTGWPVLAAVSNKDFIGETLGLPPSERGEGTQAALAISAWLGARVFRVHDVPAARRALDAVAWVRAGWPAATPS